jgi:hypothetical protein
MILGYRTDEKKRAVAHDEVLAVGELRLAEARRVFHDVVHELIQPARG